jgi:hypothetical protein
MALNSPFRAPIEKNSVDDLDEAMRERHSIEEVLADFRAKHRYARRPNWPVSTRNLSARLPAKGA